jgi:hypothetical protein
MAALVLVSVSLAIGFWAYGMRPFPCRQEYLEMLEDYKKELERPKLIKPNKSK